MTARRPLVGVTASVRGGRWMWLFNQLAVCRAGGRAVKLTADSARPAEELDALIIGGGDDIDARLYGHDLQVGVRIDPERDNLEMRCLEAAAKRGLPVLGICRGAQILNVFRGGTLHPDIYDVYIDAPRRRTPLPRKRVHIEPGTRLHSILGLPHCRVNSLHHQSVNRPGEGLRIAAKDEHGIVQGIDTESGQLIIGVQWHPEFLVFDRQQQNLYHAVIHAT